MAQIKTKFIENVAGKRDAVEVKVNQGFLDLVNGLGNMTEAAMQECGLTKAQIKAMQRAYHNFSGALESSVETYDGSIGGWQFSPSCQ